MPIVKIKYPQLYVEFVEVEVTDNELEEMKNMTNSEKAEFTEKHLSEREMINIPSTLEAAFEYDYARFIYTQT